MKTNFLKSRVMDLLGAFLAGGLLTLFFVGSAISNNDSRLEVLKKENNKLKTLGELYIGQEVYACKANFLLIGKITKIIHSINDDKVILDGYREFSKSEIYLTKDEALKQLEI